MTTNEATGNNTEPNTQPQPIVKVFISKKETDWERARRIAKRLDQIGGDRLKFFISQDISAGDDWRKCIEEELATSNALILLFGEPTEEWDWCLYEVGLFTSLLGNKKPRSVCLHTPDTELPPPLRHMQHVPAKLENMKKFLTDFFGTSEITGLEPPLNSKFAQDIEAVTDVAQKICDEINSRITKNSLFYNGFFKLNFDPDKLEDGKISDKAKVETSKMTLEMFGFLDKPVGVEHWTWDILEKPMRKEKNDGWIDSIAEQLKPACQGRALRPITETVRSLTSERIYTPTVSQRDLESDGTVTIHIMLVQQPVEADEGQVLQGQNA